MSKLPALPTFAFVVYSIEPGVEWETTPRVSAAYFQEQGEYTVFKDAEHSVVEAFKTSLVSRIVRTETRVVDAR